MDQQVPSAKNHKLFVLTGCFSALASRLANPQVVLPWIYNLIGGPLALIGFLAPSVRVGALVAQLTIVPRLLAQPIRKWAYVIAALTSAAVMLLLGITLQGADILFASVIFFSGTLLLGAASGISALSSQEVMAKSLGRDQIGRILSLQVSIAGALTLLFMSVLIPMFPDVNAGPQRYILLFLAAASWLAAAMSFALVHEPPSAVRSRKSVWAQTLEGWQLLKTEQWFRSFFFTRALFLSVGLATPFYAILAAKEFPKSADSLSLIVLATGVTSVFSTPVWSKLLTRRPDHALIWSGVIAAIAGLVALLHPTIIGKPHPVAYMLVFALLELAVQGMTQSSKTYLAVMSPAADRPTYLAIANALLGILAVIVSGLTGILAHTTHMYAALSLIIIMSLLASASALKLERPIMD